MASSQGLLLVGISRDTRATYRCGKDLYGGDKQHKPRVALKVSWDERLTGHLVRLLCDSTKPELAFVQEQSIRVCIYYISGSQYLKYPISEYYNINMAPMD